VTGARGQPTDLGRDYIFLVGTARNNFPYLVESLFLKSRWWVNELGEPDNIYSPLMETPVGRAARARVETRMIYY
jgi:hypothetical protein